MAALPVQSPGPEYFLRNLTSLKLCVLMIKDSKPVLRPMKSWPVLRMMRRRLRLRAKSTPALICSLVVAWMTYNP